uniref:Uncharacterized protein n=1 Tax=Rhizophora mucronata TaxID=61149 RepID=A0A2P2NH70_RHIMU
MITDSTDFGPAAVIRMIWQMRQNSSVTSDSPAHKARLSFPGCLGQACRIDCRSPVSLSPLSFPLL